MKNSSSNPSVDISDQEDMMRLLSKEIKESSSNLRDIAKGSLLCQSTVSRLYYHETRFPRYLTIIKLLNFFGYNLIAQKYQVTLPKSNPILRVVQPIQRM